MIVKNRLGQEIEITSIYGQYDDDIQIDACNYVDSDNEVSDEDIEYIYENYQDSLYETWHENKVSQAEAYYEGDR